MNKKSGSKMCGQLKYLARGPTEVQPGSNRGPGQRSQELNYEQYEEHTVFVDMRPSTLYVVHSSAEKLYEEHCIVVEEKSKGWLNVIALYVPRPHCSTFETFD